MSGYDTARRVATSIEKHGDTMTMSRDGEGTTVTVKGRRLAGSTAEIAGSAAQQQFRVRISPIGLAASAWAIKAPLRHDTLTIDGRDREVMDAEPLGDSGVVALYELEVVG